MNDEIKLHNTEVRINPSGHKERVKKKKGKPDEGTLNELNDLAEELSAGLDPMCPGCNNRHCGNDKYCDSCSSGATGPLANEGMDFAGPLPTGGGAGMAEQPEYDRRHNVFSAPEAPTTTGAMERPAGETLSNMTGSTPMAADGPEEQKVKAKLPANAKGNPRRNKYTAELPGDGLDRGVSHNESFTGTGAIAIAPNVSFQKSEDEEEDDEDKTDTSESLMSRNRQNNTLNEWEPPFEAGGYDPGDYQMPSPKGDGVAKKKASSDKVGSYDTDLSQDGDEWPRDHNETEAMGKVDDSGVDKQSAGSHESSSVEASDGHQDKTGHNWPDQAKNDGGGVAEPFEGNRWSDGGTLKGGSGQDDFGSAKSNQSSAAKEGPITGTDGPQYGEVEEGWSPSGIGSLMESDGINVRSLFDNYAREANYICLHDFLDLCHAHGAEVSLNEQSLMNLMDANSEFMFHEGKDASGRYWVGRLMGESDSCGECGCEPCECGDDDADCAEEGADNRPFSKMLSELQMRSPEAEARQHEMTPPGDPHIDTMSSMVPPVDEDPLAPDDYDQAMSGYQGMDAQQGPGPMSNMADMQECPECGIPGQEETCAECGAHMDMGMGEMEMGGMGMGGMDDMPSMQAASGPHPAEMDMGPANNPDLDRDIDWESDTGLDRGEAARDREYGVDPNTKYMGLDDLDEYGGPEPGRPKPGRPMESRQTKYTPRNVDALKAFMNSAKRIVSVESNSKDIGFALTESWRHYAGTINAKTTPPSVQKTLKHLMRKYRSFQPLAECSDMGESQGKPISGGGRPKVSDDLAPGDQPGPDDMKEQGDGLGGKQKNTIGTPIMKGTGQGMTGKNHSESVKRNVAKLAQHVKKPLQEAVKGINGKYGMFFTVLVKESNKRNRTTRRLNLAEALADVEELIQVYGSRRVMLEAYISQNREVVRKYNVPMISLKKRGPLVSEGKAVFRFNRTAQDFAASLVMEGITCRVKDHNWGNSVSAKASPRQANNAFRMLSESK